MKTFLPIATALVLLVFGACEEIVYVPVEGPLRVDTLKVKEYIDRYFAYADSTKIPVVVETPVQVKDDKDSIITIIQKDTVWMVRVDSVFIVETKTVYEYDTIVDRVYEKRDTIVAPFGKVYHYVPEKLKPILDEFYIDARKRGLNPADPYLQIIVDPNLDEILQAYSYRIPQGVNIVIQGRLTEDQMFIVLYRELARQYLGKQYSGDPEHPMYYSWKGIQNVRYSNRAQHKSVIDQIFK